MSQTKTAYALGADDALARLGLKEAGFGNTLLNLGSKASKALGVLPTGVGNLIAGGLGIVTGVGTALSQGEGLKGALVRGGAGALNAIPGGVGFAAGMAGDMAANSMLRKPTPALPQGWNP